MRVWTRKSKICLFLAIFAALATVFFLIWLKTDWQMLEDERKGRDYKPSAAMTQIADELQLTRKGRAVFYATKPTLQDSSQFNQKCGKDDSASYTLGCYYEDTDEHINIFDNGLDLFKNDLISYDFRVQRSVATLHEMLHAVYARLDNQAEICAELRPIVSSYPQMERELLLYNKSQYCTEAFARIGSEHADALQDTSLAKIYNDYFAPNSNLIAKYSQNETQLANLDSLFANSRKNLKNERSRVESLIASQSFYANNAIDNYNQLVLKHNALAKELRAIYSNLDSGRAASL